MKTNYNKDYEHRETTTGASAIKIPLDDISELNMSLEASKNETSEENICSPVLSSSLEFIDIMVDLEALNLGDKGRDPKIIQFAAVAFNILTGEIYNFPDEIFNEYCLVEETDLPLIRWDTLTWWLKTNPAKLSEILEKGKESNKKEKRVILDFIIWINSMCEKYTISKSTKAARLWGNGENFDNKIIKTLCDKYDCEYPITYYNDRDMRTIVQLAADKIHIDSKEYRALYPMKGTAHDALDDVTNQIEVTSGAYRMLINPNFVDV